MIAAVIIFALAYVLMLIFGKFRPYISIGAGVLFLIFGILPIGELFSSIDFNVIMMIAGTMGLVALFTESKMPNLLADIIMSKVPNIKWAAVSLALFAGIISAFVDNVATVLMIAPVALAICKKLDVNPVPFIIAIAVSSNLQGAATLIGDTTAIMLGSALDMSFLDFFWFKGKPSIFFAVEIGAVIAALILLIVFRKETKSLDRNLERTKVLDLVPTFFLIVTMLLLIGSSFIKEKPEITNGVICCAMLLIALIYTMIKKRSFKAVIPSLKEIDFNTIGILLGLFLMIGGLESAGVIKLVADFISNVAGDNIFLLYTIIVWGSVIISAFIDNIPYVATMIPILTGIAANLGIDPTVLLFGLLSGATLGGNITPVGASANITGIGILRKEGYEVKNSDFFKIGIPFTLAAIIPAYIFIWVFFGV